MLEHGAEGHIVNTVSHNGGIMPAPDTAPYAVAKGSVVTYTECLWSQLRGLDSKIGVSLLFPSGYSPGLLNTGIWSETYRPAEYAPSTPHPPRSGIAGYAERLRAIGPGSDLHAARGGR